MKQRAFTLIEMLVAMAIVLALFGAMIVATKHLKTESQRRLTASAIAVVETALEQYYDQYKAFPFKNRDNDPNDGKPDTYTVIQMQEDIGGNADVVAGGNVEVDGAGNNICNASSAGLFYFLYHCQASRQIIEAINNTLITSKDALTDKMSKIVVGGVILDMPRFIDTWGSSLRYAYLAGDTFPVVTSAGPDKIFDTEDDVVSQ